MTVTKVVLIGAGSAMFTQGLVADGRIDTAPLHTGTVALDGLADAFARLTDAPEEVKVLVDPR